MRGKKCIPGLFCIENTTFFLLFVLLITVTYLYYNSVVKLSSKPKQGSVQGFHNGISGINPTVIVVSAPPQPINNLATVSSRTDPLRNYNAPPLTNEGSYPSDIAGVPGLPVNVRTRGYDEDYKQVGILTRVNGKGDMILPLMGRRGAYSRSKYQYYTMTNTTGNINTKLPVSVNGRSCTAELGCDQISNGDTVFVEGYNDTFRATIYENSLLSYLPF